MKRTEIFNKITGVFNKANFKLRKHSPEILIAVGVVGVVTSAVMACKATMKISDVLDETSDKLDRIHECMENEDVRKDIAKVYVQTGIKFAHLYAPSVALGVISLSSIIASNNILHKRNIALTAAYTTIDKSFKMYRSRVVEQFGSEIDRQLKYNIKSMEIDEKITDENGKEKTVKKTVDTIELNDYSDYARFFDATSPYWEKDSEYNLMFLRNQQNYANDKLKAKGILFLNEVYEMLGIQPTKAGQVVGWVYDSKNPIGDNFVDFGIYDIGNQANRNFVNGYENVILLDFNVDGNVWEMM